MRKLRSGTTLVKTLALVLAMVACHRATPTQWTRGATCYEIFVRSFRDSDGDGIGDVNGVTEKLDHVRDLGARCIWLMPVAESPSYHGYDVANYYAVDREYGSARDFQRLVREAHRRDLRVLVDLVLNHASSEHPAFQAALRDTASPYRDWFRWSPTDPGTKGPWGQTVWHKSPVRNEWYYGIFWRGMPDLNYENPAVREEAKKVATFWLKDMGVDGFRLDAVPYLVEEGSQVRDTRGTHDVLREWSAHVRRIAPHAYTVGEVWDSVGSMLPYYPDQLDAYFAFELSDSILGAVRTGSARALYGGYLRLQRAVPAERYAPFLRNHDQTRTLTALGPSLRSGQALARVKLATTLLFTLPGLPFVYYGEEIGMTGDKPDEDLRTPMQWTDAPGAGFTSGTPWRAVHGDVATANVARQLGDSSSLLEHYRRLIHLRRTNPALASGTLVPLQTSDSSIAAFIREAGTRRTLVIANLADRPAPSATVMLPAGLVARGHPSSTFSLPPLGAQLYDLTRP